MAKHGSQGYLGIGAIYRWEARDLREWVAFHRVVGVERFFLYDNASEDDHLEALAPFIEDGSVTVHHWPVFPGQGSAYDHCLAHHGDEARWIAFLDADEFLFSPTGRPLPEVLRDYEQHPGIGVSRAWMGTSGHETRPEGLVLANFSSRLHLPEPNRSVKSIVDPSRVARRVNEHWFEYEDGAADRRRAPPAARVLDPGRAHLRRAPDQPLLHEVRGGGAPQVRPAAGRRRQAAARAQAPGPAAQERAPRAARRRDPAVPARARGADERVD